MPNVGIDSIFYKWHARVRPGVHTLRLLPLSQIDDLLIERDALSVTKACVSLSAVEDWYEGYTK